MMLGTSATIPFFYYTLEVSGIVFGTLISITTIQLRHEKIVSLYISEVFTQL